MSGRAAALLGSPLRAVNLGLETFALELERAGVTVTHVDWRPPAGAEGATAGLLERLEARRDAIDRANADAVTRLGSGEPALIDCRPAREALGLPDGTVLHAGPPLDWARACEPMRAAILCAIRYEGWERDGRRAAHLVERGEVRLEPCHHRGAVGPMTGIVTPSMPVFVVANRRYGNRAFATLNEGLGRVLRFGATDESVVTRLTWLAAEAGPLLGRALRDTGGIDLRTLMAQALRMGDEMHQRNVAASALLARALMAPLARVTPDSRALARLAEFVASNDQFFLNVAMAAAKAWADPAAGVANSTMVTAMARNGTDFGLRVSGQADRWFTAPVQAPVGLYFPGFGPDDANPDMGDSAIVETIGLGACAMAASPAAARFVGAGGAREALAATEEMQDISIAEHPHFRIAALAERGTPTGIDVRRVVETGITPLINTGIAGRRAGTGQIGAGVARAPIACFVNALEAFLG
jgi:uncharacterized protein DUF1116